MNRNQKDLIVETIKPIKYRNCLYTMRIGQYEAEVNCTKKKEGRQFAAQKILKVTSLEPQLESRLKYLVSAVQLAIASTYSKLGPNASTVLCQNDGSYFAQR